MKKSLLALAVAASVASFAANAAVEGSFALGAGAGWTHAFNTDVTAPAEVGDKNGYALQLNGEYNFTDWFRLGLGYDYLNGAKIEELKSKIDIIDNNNTILQISKEYKQVKDNKEASKSYITSKANLIAKVFGVDSKSTQSGWFIITLKLTDYTDSIIANIFTKKQEEFDYLLQTS